MQYKNVRIGEVLRPSREPIDLKGAEEYSSIGMKSFGRGIFHYDPREPDDLPKLRYFRFPAGALAFSNIKAWEGAVAVTTEKDTASIASNRFLFYSPLRPNEVDTRFLRYYFLSERGLSRIGQASPGSADRNRTLSIKSFESLEIEIPANIEDQRRIADKLDVAMSKVGAILEKTPNSGPASQLAVSGLDHVLMRWSDGIMKVSDVCSLVGDTVHPGDDTGQAESFVGLEHIKPHFGQCIGSKPLGDEKGRKFRFQPGDVLYGYLRPYLNKVWPADRHGLCSVEQYVLRPMNSMPAEIVAACLRSRSTLEMVLSATHNLQLPRLRSSLLMAMEIPRIPEENYGNAVEDINSFMTQVQNLESKQHERDELVSKLRPAMLNAVFSRQL